MTSSRHPTCELCNKQSGHTSIPSEGAVEAVTHGTRTQASCLMCKNLFDSHSTLRDHLILEHNLDLYKEVKQFSDIKEFDTWRLRKEHKFHCKYRMCDHLHNQEVNNWTYFCNTSSSHPPMHQNRKRKLDEDKPSELFFCASTIELVEDLQTHAYEAVLFTPHTHDPVFFAYLSADETSLQGHPTGKVTFDSMLDTIRDNLYGSKEYIHVPNAEEVKKMQRRFSVQSKLYFDDNHLFSIDIWANNMARLEDQSPVVYYKPQGLLDENSPLLSADDFVMILMTPFQCEILQEFGKNIVCVDCIRGSVTFNFSLTTFMIATERGEVLPVSYLVSNTVDENILTHYFSILRNQTSNIQPKVLMTNDHPVFSQAWRNAFPEPEKQLLTAWHVDQNWRKQLQKVEDSMQERAQIYKAVRLLMELADDRMFDNLMNSVIREFFRAPSMKSFSDYFKTYYAARKHQWAFCYRKEISSKTNNHLEAFHRCIKQIYVESRKVKRVDGLVDALMKLTKDKLFTRFRKMYKPKLLADNYDNHYRSKVIRKEDTYQVYNDVWLVHSVSRNLDYVVHKEDDCGKRNCEMKCMQCNVCVHTFSCNCPYYYLNFSICKHIHAICNIGSSGVDNGFANINNLLSYTVSSEGDVMNNSEPSTSATTSEYTLEANPVVKTPANNNTLKQICAQTNSDGLLPTSEDTSNPNMLIIPNNLKNEVQVLSPTKNTAPVDNNNININNIIQGQEITENIETDQQMVTESLTDTVSNNSENPTSEMAEPKSENVSNENSMEEPHLLITQATVNEDSIENNEYYVMEEKFHPEENYLDTEEVNGDEAQYYEYSNAAEVKERIQQKIEFIRECLMKNSYDYRILIKVEQELDRVLKLFSSYNSAA